MIENTSSTTSNLIRVPSEHVWIGIEHMSPREPVCLTSSSITGAFLLNGIALETAQSHFLNEQNSPGIF
jgi:hypothetical protein